MANICSVTMYFYGEKNAVEDLHAKCERWMNTGGRAAKLLSALNISKEDLEDLRCEACYVGELFVDSTGEEWFGVNLDCAEDATPAVDIFDRIISRDYVEKDGKPKIKYTNLVHFAGDDDVDEDDIW